MTGPERKQFADALRGAFSFADFDLLLDYQLKDHVQNHMQPGEPVGYVFDRAVRSYDMQGTYPRLLAAALAARPYASPLLAFARVLSGVSGLTRPESDGLESFIVKTNAMLDLGVWLERAARVQAILCRIEVLAENGQTTYGTGFLVAPALVMTNYHVVEALAATEDATLHYAGPRALASETFCRFDYAAMASGAVGAGLRVPLAVNWRVLLSPNNPDTRPPLPHELDLAILRLAAPIGDQPLLPDSAVPSDPRGYLDLAASTPSLFAADTPLFIAQHPQGQPIKLALDTTGLLGADAARLRVGYRTNTQPGSSGSPCFDARWNPIALHHRGDPGFGQVAGHHANEGIPLDTILAFARAHHVPL